MRSRRECVSRGAGAARTCRRCPASWGSSSPPRPCSRHGGPGGSSGCELGMRGRRCSSTPSVSSSVSVHTLYTSAPPGRDELHRRVDQLASAGRRGDRRPRAAMRQRASGRRRSTPRPEHGASTSTRSKPPARSGRCRASATTTEHGGDSSASTLARRRPHAALRARPTATTSAPGRGERVALPPGAAHRSATRSPGCASTRSATHCDATSWT